MNAGEFDLIARLRARIAARDDVPLGIGDDAALLQPPAGHQLAITADTLNAGVHFPHDTAPADIGWKSLAVNLSDLAAMGATPAWCTLSLSVPHNDAAWWDGFLDGFLSLAGTCGIGLVGGDTTRGPLSIAVTAIGFVPSGRALRRDAARIGDDIWVSGTLGDAAAALAQWPNPAPALRTRLDRPTPRVALGHALRDHARAAIDVSDGLLADLAHVCAASRVGAQVELARLPASDALLTLNDARRIEWQATGGDDYEVCFTADSNQRAAIEHLAHALHLPLTRIGRIGQGQGVQALDAHGNPWHPARAGYTHF